ncbi:MAG TPA: hypothetical protein VK564_06865 [Thermodesulfobacteriota bacterium]|nr:hypothetical protein [Thermodesulfobacteriota bacterium]
MSENGLSHLNIRVLRAKALSGVDRERVHQLFELTYRQANHEYLERSLLKLKYVALATDQDKPAGFALADMLEAPLPGLPEPQNIMLAGICCVAPEFRRLGLFTRLEVLAARESGLFTPGKRILTCGRMAHPVSFRTLRNSPTVIPNPGRPLSDWHKEVGVAVAELYGVNLDPETFVVQGAGRPIGYPDLEFEITAEEWLPFQAVNRDRGDSLLGIAWFPDAPEGW